MDAREDRRDEGDDGARVRVFDSAEELFAAAADRFVETGERAVERRGSFTVALSGGSTPEGLYRRLAREPRRDRVPWDRIQLFWSDERWVDHDHPDSNYRMAKEALLDAVPVARERVHPVPTNLADPERGAERYEEQLRSTFGLPLEGLPRFDLILLGIGADGHTASLFPGDPAVYEHRHPVAVVDPPENADAEHRRVTLTLDVLNAARSVLFLVVGAAKAGAVAAALRSSRQLPAAKVDPPAGELRWYLDAEAAAEL